MAKFAPTKTVKPEQVEIGQSIEVHAQSLATFKTYVSMYNRDRDLKIRFEYGPFIGNFSKATRVNDELKRTA